MKESINYSSIFLAAISLLCTNSPKEPYPETSFINLEVCVADCSRNISTLESKFTSCWRGLLGKENLDILRLLKGGRK
jgi:hypothetical protein